MAKTKIAWADETINPVMGCTKVSLGCKNCYAVGMSLRLAAMGIPGYGGVEHDGGWSGEIHYRPDVLDKKLQKLPRKPQRIFLESMGDLFHAGVKQEWLDKIFAKVQREKHHTFMVLTKRPARMVEYFTEHDIPDNVWLGVTAENQEMAEERILHLLRLDPPVAFVSIEPCLGAIDLSLIPNANLLDWVIVGGESGKNARPMHPDWARGIRKFCDAQEIPFFFKQWGEWLPADQINPNLFLPEQKWEWVSKWEVARTNTSTHTPAISDQKMGRVGKQVAGHLLDDVEYLNLPKVATILSFNEKKEG